MYKGCDSYVDVFVYVTTNETTTLHQTVCTRVSVLIKYLF